MFRERPTISFGPPETFAEAVYRLGDYPRKDDEQLFRMGTLHRMLTCTPINVELSSLRSRVLHLEKDDVTFMEKWSFRRIDSWGLEILWHPNLSRARTSYFKDVFPTDIKRAFTIWYLQPLPIRDHANLLCIKAEPGFEHAALEDEWFVALLSPGEHNLLIGLTV